MTWTDKLIGDKEERAVSPVIGVILMVAITVILAAVIAAFVMDIGPGSSTATGAADISSDGTIELTDASQLDGVALVDSGGEIIGNNHDVNTGQTLDATSGSDFTPSAASSSVTVYGYVGPDPTASGSAPYTLDDTDGNVELGEYEP